MRLRKLSHHMNLRGKRILVRIDGNVPVKRGRVEDGPHGRIARSAVGLQWLSQRGAKVIVLTHLGRPEGKKISAYSVKPVGKRLAGLLGMKVRITRSVIGEDVTKAVNSMQEGDVLLLENIRFDAREKENSPSFAQALAKLADVYVNDAFAVSHRAHTSVDAITCELPSFAGPLLAQEISVLSRLEKNTKHPFVLVLGGLKMSTKLPIIERFISQLDFVLVGGALATVFFVAQGKSVGKSVYEKEIVAKARQMLDAHQEKIVLPSDVLIARSLRRDAKKNIVSVDSVGLTDSIVDIGPQTIDRFGSVLALGKTIVWNGPLGLCEIETFCEGTKAIAHAIAARTGKATTIVGGGDTMPCVEHMGLADKFTLLSTGGGALLQFLSGQTLPGLEALKI